MDGESWDRALLELDGTLMQSWRWGEYKRSHGWEVERVRTTAPNGVAMAQILFRQFGPISFAYVPHGPALAGDAAAVFPRLVADLDVVCHRRGAATLIIEPARPLPLRGTYRRAGFVRGPAHMQVVETIKVPLGGDDEMLARMRKKTRSTVRRGERRGVVVERATLGDDAAFSTFHALIGETGERLGFPLRARAYYEEVLRLFGDDAALLLAMVDGEAVAGELVVRFGDEAHSLYAGSSTLRRVNGATAYLEFEVLRWARDQGCRRLDLWGTDWVGMPDEGTAWYKLGFGGEIVGYPPTLERRYRPIVSWGIRRALALYHASVT